MPDEKPTCVSDQMKILSIPVSSIQIISNQTFNSNNDNAQKLGDEERVTDQCSQEDIKDVPDNLGGISTHESANESFGELHLRNEAENGSSTAILPSTCPQDELPIQTNHLEIQQLDQYQCLEDGYNTTASAADGPSTANQPSPSYQDELPIQTNHLETRELDQYQCLGEGGNTTASASSENLPGKECLTDMDILTRNIDFPEPLTSGFGFEVEEFLQPPEPQPRGQLHQFATTSNQNVKCEPSDVVAVVDQQLKNENDKATYYDDMFMELFGQDMAPQSKDEAAEKSISTNGASNDHQGQASDGQSKAESQEKIPRGSFKVVPAKRSFLERESSKPSLKRFNNGQTKTPNGDSSGRPSTIYHQPKAVKITPATVQNKTLPIAAGVQLQQPFQQQSIENNAVTPHYHNNFQQPHSPSVYSFATPQQQHHNPKLD